MKIPRGWGIGIPIGDTFVSARESAEDRVARVLASTQADWYQTWMPYPYAYQPTGAFFPAAQEADIPVVQLDHAANSTLLILNEPERGWSDTLLMPTSAGMATTWQLARLWQIGHPFAWCAPNSNINGKNLEWMTAYADWLWQHGSVAPTFWGIHFYGKVTGELNYHLTRFWEWWEAHGQERPVVVTEFGPGRGATVQEALTIMEYGRRILDDPRVIGTCFFAGGVAYQGHPDVCADPILLKRFIDLK